MNGTHTPKTDSAGLTNDIEAPPSERTAVPPRTPLRGRLAVVSVMLGIFSIVTTEILPIGLLTSIGSDFAVSDGSAGLMMTMPGLLAAVSAPLVTVATARVDRRVMLCAFMLLLALADFPTAAASDYRLVLVSPVMVGVTIGGFWSIGAGLAGRLVRPASVGRATAVIFSAVPLGSVLGVPVGTFIGSQAGWRTAFVVMGVLSVGVLALMLLVVPALRVRRPRPVRGGPPPGGEPVHEEEPPAALGLRPGGTWRRRRGQVAPFVVRDVHRHLPVVDGAPWPRPRKPSAPSVSGSGRTTSSASRHVSRPAPSTGPTRVAGCRPWGHSTAASPAGSRSCCAAVGTSSDMSAR
ncbi:MFS transporter [Streptomyces sp. NPDC047515]|uniref:MFS transporter n=1 Tax=Streptomyces sp. NPDC047515 TaxID=3155380 RepID=UPI0033E2358F